VNEPLHAQGSGGDGPAADTILLLLPYFGPLPGYADLFFRSCAHNPSIDWLLITDQTLAPSRLPANVKVLRTTFDAVRRSVDDVLGFRATLPTPYKLVDFRPIFGLVFAEAMAGYDFWGHCDMDMLFGDLRRFITAEILRGYNKVLIHGHLSLYRNCDEANHYFELESPGVNFRDVFTSPKNRAFDEFGGIRLLLNHHKIPFFRDDRLLADINRNVYRLETIHPPNYRHQCFYWEHGRLWRDSYDGTCRRTQEFACMHLQKRAMARPPAPLAASDGWFITPRGFVPKTTATPTSAEMDRLNPDSRLYNVQRVACSLAWRAQWTVQQVVDPWPRRS
jgi:hypothetical protein